MRIDISSLKKTIFNSKEITFVASNEKNCLDCRFELIKPRKWNIHCWTIEIPLINVIRSLFCDLSSSLLVSEKKSLHKYAHSCVL